MILKHRVMDPKQLDEISEALAYTETPLDGAGKPTGEPYRVVPVYIYHWYPNGLRERTAGPHSRDRVGMTRYYPTLDPRVVIDFEPAPPERWYAEEKRQFCFEKGIVYLPIGLNERMDEAGFAERLKAAKDLLHRMTTEGGEDSALKDAEKGVEDWLLEPALMALLDAKALRDVEEEFRGRKLFGGARNKVLKRKKQELIEQLRAGLKSGRIVDPYECYREPTHSAE